MNYRFYPDEPGQPHSGFSVNGVCVEGSKSSIDAVMHWYWKAQSFQGLVDRLIEAERNVVKLNKIIKEISDVPS